MVFSRVLRKVCLCMYIASRGGGESANEKEVTWTQEFMVFLHGRKEWASQELIALTKHVQDTYLAVIVAPHCFYSHRAQNV